MTTLAEQEFNLNITADNPNVIQIYSNYPKYTRKLLKIGATLIRTDGHDGHFFTLPKNQLSLRNPSKGTRRKKATNTMLDIIAELDDDDEETL